MLKLGRGVVSFGITDLPAGAGSGRKELPGNPGILRQKYSRSMPWRGRFFHIWPRLSGKNTRFVPAAANAIDGVALRVRRGILERPPVRNAMAALGETGLPIAPGRPRLEASVRISFSILRLAAVAIAAATGLGCSRSPDASPSAARSNAESTAKPKAGDAPAKAADGFLPLRLADFEVFQGKARPTEPTWTEDGALLRCTGSPRGYLYSKQNHRDFTLRAELRYASSPDLDSANANTGLFVYIKQPHRVWPVCIEVQGKQVEMAAIKGNGRPNPLDPALVRDDEAGRRTARRPVGEWNVLEVDARGGELTTFLNGKKIAVSAPCELRDGPIGIQAEGYPYEIRNLRIKDELPR